jgi:hypothetical protein
MVPMPNEEDQKALWRFANNLAEGNICGDMNDAFEYELLELLDGQISKEPNLALNCYGRSEIDTWSIHNPMEMTDTSPAVRPLRWAHGNHYFCGAGQRGETNPSACGIARGGSQSSPSTGAAAK